MGEVAALDRYYDAVSYMDLNASYTFGKKIKTTFYADATNLLNQPLRYYQGTKDRTMQSEHYGVKINAGVKTNGTFLLNPKNRESHSDKRHSYKSLIIKLI